MKATWFWLLFPAIYSCGSDKKINIAGYWKLVEIETVNTPTNRDKMYSESVKEGTNSIKLLFRDDSSYISKSIFLGAESSREEGKYSLSSDGKYLKLFPKEVEVAKPDIRVVSIAIDTMKLQFVKDYISVFTRNDLKDWNN